MIVLEIVGYILLTVVIRNVVFRFTDHWLMRDMFNMPLLMIWPVPLCVSIVVVIIAAVDRGIGKLFGVDPKNKKRNYY